MAPQVTGSSLVPMDAATKRRLRQALQQRLRGLLLRCFPVADQSDARFSPILARLQALVANFELRLSTRVSNARAGAQWERLRAMLPGPAVHHVRQIPPTTPPLQQGPTVAPEKAAAATLAAEQTPAAVAVVALGRIVEQ